MQLYLNSVTCSLAHLEDLDRSTLSDTEQYVVDFITQWLDGQTHFTFNTSGSTGVPQVVRLNREQLAYSAKQTLNYFFCKQPPRAFHLCINPRFVGGTQQIVRALLTESDLIVQTPSAMAMLDLKSHVSLTAVFPRQLKSAMDGKINWSNFDNVLVGGAAIDPYIESTLPPEASDRVYFVYGMTETASHIAVRPSGQRTYQVLGDCLITVDDRGCLRLKGTITQDQWLQTNDRVTLHSTKSFEYLGRVDWVINSGGHKIHPETLERKLSKHIQSSFIISSQPSDKWGEEVVLVADQPMSIPMDEIDLHPYERPKKVLTLKQWPLLSSGKTDRKKIKDQLWSSK